MNALAIQTPTFTSGVRMVMVRGDNMEPGLRRERDWVVMLPCEDFLHEGIYVLDMDGRGTAVRRVQLWGKGEVGILSDNPAYGATPSARMQVISRRDFQTICLGFVVGRLLIDELATLHDVGFEVGF